MVRRFLYRSIYFLLYCSIQVNSSLLQVAALRYVSLKKLRSPRSWPSRSFPITILSHGGSRRSLFQRGTVFAIPKPSTAPTRIGIIERPSLNLRGLQHSAVATLSEPSSVQETEPVAVSALAAPTPISWPCAGTWLVATEVVAIIHDFRCTCRTLWRSSWMPASSGHKVLTRAQFPPARV